MLSRGAPVFPPGVTRMQHSMFSLRRWQMWALSFLCWTVYGALATTASRGFLVSIHAKATLEVLVSPFTVSYLWALLTPLIFVIARTYSFNRDSWRKSLLVHLPISLLMSAAVTGIRMIVNTTYGFADHSVPLTARMLQGVLQNLPLCFATMGIAQAAVYSARIRKREMESSHLEARLAEAQLEILRSQLEPHFLFNTLNSIATLTRKDPASAERMTIKLASLLRVSLDCVGSQEISLEKELQFLQNYVEIQKTRFRDRLTVHLNIDPDLLPFPVPSLILQPLVENAIRHGIAKSAGPGWVDIRAARENGSMRIEIADNGPGIVPKSDGDTGGFGLRNTRARLRQLYGNQHHFRVESVPGGGCRVILVLPASGTAKATVR